MATAEYADSYHFSDPTGSSAYFYTNTYDYNEILYIEDYFPFILVEESENRTWLVQPYKFSAG